MAAQPTRDGVGLNGQVQGLPGPRNCGSIRRLHAANDLHMATTESATEVAARHAVGPPTCPARRYPVPLHGLARKRSRPGVLALTQTVVLLLVSLTGFSSVEAAWLSDLRGAARPAPRPPKPTPKLTPKPTPELPGGHTGGIVGDVGDDTPVDQSSRRLAETCYYTTYYTAYATGYE